jgi:hypothetical protein
MNYEYTVNFFCFSRPQPATGTKLFLAGNYEIIPGQGEFV